jgi:hypothetical protein
LGPELFLVQKAAKKAQFAPGREIDYLFTTSVRSLAMLMLLAMPLCAAGQAASPPRQVMGWLERIVLLPWGVRVKAKLDTGAKTSSLDAQQLAVYDNDGERWVRFVLPVAGKKKAEKRIVQLPLVREVAIKRHGQPSAKRPVVSLSFCLAGRRQVAEFSLVDRGHYNYPVLLGRRFLKNVAIVDPAAKYLTDASCVDPAAPKSGDVQTAP